MATRLKNIVKFENMVDGVNAMPHYLNIDNMDQGPDFLVTSLPGFEVSADETNVYVTKDGNSPSDAVDVFVEHWHSFDRFVGSQGYIDPQPFVVNRDRLNERHTLTYSPYGTKNHDGGVFTDWYELMAYHESLPREAYKEIFFDAGNFQGISIPAKGFDADGNYEPWDMYNTKLKSDGDFIYFYTFACRMKNVIEIDMSGFATSVTPSGASKIKPVFDFDNPDQTFYMSKLIPTNFFGSENPFFQMDGTRLTIITRLDPVAFHGGRCINVINGGQFVQFPHSGPVGFYTKTIVHGDATAVWEKHDNDFAVNIWNLQNQVNFAGDINDKFFGSPLFAVPIQEAVVNYDAADGDFFCSHGRTYKIDTSTSAVTAKLPECLQYEGQRIVIKCHGANDVTVEAVPDTSIDGDTSRVLKDGESAIYLANHTEGTWTEFFLAARPVAP